MVELGGPRAPRCLLVSDSSRSGDQRFRSAEHGSSLDQMGGIQELNFGYFHVEIDGRSLLPG